MDAVPIVRSRLAAIGGPNLNPYHIASIEDRVRKPNGRRRRFIIPAVLPIGPAFLYGASGSGKTGIAINIALAVASGGAWAGTLLEQSSVLYLPAEDRFGVEERLVAACEAADMDPVELALAVPDIEGMPSLESLKSEAARLQEQTGLPVRLIVLDTFGAAYGDKSQDDAGAASSVMNFIERISRALECCVLCVHHTGKGNSPGMRGSQVFVDRANAVIRADRRAGFTSLRVEKLKNGRDGAAFAFTIRSHLLTTSDGSIDVQVVQDVRPLATEDEEAQAARQTRREQTDADVAQARLLELATAGVASLKDWQAACFDAWADKQGNRQRVAAFSKAKKAFETKGFISISGDIVTVTTSNVTGDSPVTGKPSKASVTVTVTDPPPKGGQGDRRRVPGGEMENV